MPEETLKIRTGSMEGKNLPHDFEYKDRSKKAEMDEIKMDI